MTDNPGADLGSAHGSIEIDVNGLIKAQRQVEQAAKAMTAALSGVKTGVEQTEKAVKNLQVSGAGLSAAGGLLNRLGLPGGQGLQTAGQALSAVSGLKKLDDQLTPFVANLSKSGGIIGGLAEKGGMFISSLTGMGAAISTVAAVALPVVGVMAALTLAVGNFANVVEQGRKAVEDAVTGQAKYYKFIATHTSEDARKQIKEAQITQSANLRAAEDVKNKIRPTLAELRLTPDQIEEALKPGARNRPPSGTSAQGLTLAPLFEELDKLNAAAAESGAEIDKLSAGIERGDFAARDAEAATRSYVQSQIQLAQVNADQAKQFVQDDALTHDAATERLDTLKRERQGLIEQMNALQELAKTNEEAEKEYNRLNTIFSIVTAEIEHMEKISVPIARLKEGLDAAAELFQKTAEYNEETAKITAQRQVQATREAQDFDLRRGRDRADFAKQQARDEVTQAKDRAKRVAGFVKDEQETESKANQERLKALQEQAVEDIRNAEDHARALAEIERDRRETVLEAAARLDARAVFEANRQAKQKTDSENEQYGVERRRRRDDFDVKLRELVENAGAERQARYAAFQQQLAQDDAQAEERRKLERADFAARLKREDEDRATAKRRRDEDNAEQDRERAASFKKQTQELRDKLLTPEEVMKAASYTAQLLGLGGFISAANALWNGLKLPQIPAGMTTPPNTAVVTPAGPVQGPPNTAVVTPVTSTSDVIRDRAVKRTAPNRGRAPARGVVSSFQEGTSFVPRTGLYQLHAGEVVARPDVANLMREVLGSRNFSQPQLAAAVAAGGRGGLTVNAQLIQQPGMSDQEFAHRAGIVVEQKVIELMEAG